ncbi:hypothetical protein [Ensifer adhaerens]|uniref:hypothetical protein n=1 Tax=Ensifer adhaerens TaxID=106592 RepID=UPI000DC2B5E4|nr:hypothetical protein [Ensifer adhaerens]RAS13548.1 hypothetical protein DEU52_106146 [Ensifer adhaerens]
MIKAIYHGPSRSMMIAGLRWCHFIGNIGHSVSLISERHEGLHTWFDVWSNDKLLFSVNARDVGMVELVDNYKPERPSAVEAQP